MSIRKQDPEVVIAIMGGTGSGKSSFVNLVSGSHLATSGGLKSCTSSVQIGTTFELEGRSVTLVDTPGFDDTTMSDTDVLKMIAVYLAATYENGFRLSGVIYMYRITDNRVGGTSLRNFRMLKQLCGEDMLANVAIVATMWDLILEERGVAREEELKSEHHLFGPVIEEGARMFRHNNTLASAQDIVRYLMKKPPQPLRIQKELVDQGKNITETAAGLELQGELEALAQKHRRALEAVREEMAMAIREKDLQSKAELDETRAALEKKIRIIEDDKERLSRAYEKEKRVATEQIRTLKETREKETRLREELEGEIVRISDALRKQEGRNLKLQLENSSLFNYRKRLHALRRQLARITLDRDLKARELDEAKQALDETKRVLGDKIHNLEIDNHRLLRELTKEKKRDDGHVDGEAELVKADRKRGRSAGFVGRMEGKARTVDRRTQSPMRG